MKKILMSLTAIFIGGNMLLADPLIVSKKDLTLTTGDSANILIKEGAVLPFKMVETSNNEYICEMIDESIPFNFQNNKKEKVRINFSVDAFTLKEIKIESLKNVFKSESVTDLTSAYWKFKDPFFKYITIQKLIHDLWKTESNNEVKKVVYDFFSSKETKPYTYILTGNMNTGLPLSIIYPIAFKSTDNNITYKEIALNTVKITKFSQNFVGLTTEEDFIFFTKTAEEILKTKDVNVAYNDILVGLDNYFPPTELKNYQTYLDKNKKLDKLNIYLSILLTMNEKSAKNFLEDKSMPKSLKIALIKDFVNITYGIKSENEAIRVRDAFKDILTKKNNSDINMQIFEVIPTNLLTKSSSIIITELYTNPPTDGLLFVEKRFKELMHLKDSITINPAINLLKDYSLLNNIRLFYENKTGAFTNNEITIINSALFTIYKNNNETLKVLLKADEEVSDSLLSLMGSILLNEIDTVIGGVVDYKYTNKNTVTNLMQDKKGVEFLGLLINQFKEVQSKDYVLLSKPIYAEIDAKEIMYKGFQMENEKDLTEFFLLVGKYTELYPDKVHLTLRPFFEYYFIKKFEQIVKTNPIFKEKMNSILDKIKELENKK